VLSKYTSGLLGIETHTQLVP